MPAAASSPGPNMSRLHLDQPLPLKLSLAIVMVAGILGCSGREEIRHYEAPKIVSVTDNGDVDATAATERMLAAIVAHENKAWFFKVVGPQAAVGEQADNFRSLIQSLEFADGVPKWKLPNNWRETPGTGIRFATLEVKSGDTDLEISVTSLPKPPGDDSAYNLANINRWRGQLQLGPLPANALARESEQVDYKGGTAILVDIVGTSGAGGGPGRPPFAGVNSDLPPDSRPPTARSTLSFDKPDGWEEGELVVSRGGITLRHEAAFTATDGNRQVEITVDRFPPAGGTLANVNRWRRQVGLPPQDEAAYRDSAGQIELAGKKRDYVQLIGEEQTILGVIAEQDDAVWFIKLMGDNDLAKAQREPFEAFVESIRFQ